MTIETILLHKMHKFMLNLSLDKIFQEKNEKFFVSTSVLYLIEFFCSSLVKHF